MKVSAVSPLRCEMTAAQPGAVRPLDRLEGLGQRADLVQFDEDRVARVLADAPFEELRVRDEEIVADELDAVAQLLGERLPVRPVVLRQAVLDGDDRVLRDEVLVVGDQLRRA